MLPRGTGTDFVREFGIPRELDGGRGGRAGRPTCARSTSAASPTAPGRGGEAVGWFANVASAGMSGAIAKRTNESSKAIGGKASYLWSTLAVFSRWHADSVAVTVDGERASATMHNVIVANCRYFGGGMKICPEAVPTTASSTCSCSAT